jgi:NAD(P)-dependent dehydrogenase (short-subunit alcohol dehydrogenase family)
MVSADDLPGWTTAFEAQQADTWRRALEVNLTAPFVLTQAAVPALSVHGGAVVMVGSIYGMLGPDLRLYEGTPMGNSAAYAVSKGGLLQLTRWLATTLAPRIRVNMITLGGIARDQPDPFPRRYADRTPLARMGREEDIKGAVALLTSDAGAYMTGQNLIVDGGFGTW